MYVPKSGYIITSIRYKVPKNRGGSEMTIQDKQNIAIASSVNYRSQCE